MMRIFVTGANGFIGKYLADNLNSYIINSNLLVDDLIVTGITRDNLDLRDSLSVTNYFLDRDLEYGYDSDIIVVNCAAIGGSYDRALPEAVIRSNIGIVDNLYRCYNHGYIKKLIQIGSGAQYANTNQAMTYEHNNSLPQSAYGLSKHLSTRLFNPSDPDVMTIVPFGVFGNGEDSRRLFPTLIRTYQEGRFPFIVHDREFDMIGIEDLMRIVAYYCVNQAHDNIINAVYPEKVNLINLVQQFCAAHQLNPQIEKGEAQNPYSGYCNLPINLVNDLEGLNKSISCYKV